MKASQLHKFGNLLKYVLCVLVPPVAIGIVIYRIIEFKKYTKIMRDVINANDDLYNYLNKYEFIPDWLGRLYSVQPIPKEFRDFTDDELYDITMRSMLPLMKLLEKSVLIDVVSVVVSRISREFYNVTITPYCWPKLVKSCIMLHIVSVIWIICGVTYACFM